MKFVIKTPYQKEVGIVEIQQDGDDVNIRLDGDCIAYLNSQTNEFVVFGKAIRRKELTWRINQ